MKAVTWQGPQDVRVEDVPDPTIVDPTDAVIRVTSTGLCGSDLHLYDPLAPFMTPGDVVGHEPMGVVEEVGSEVRDLKVGDRVVVPFNISCGHCWMCERGLHSQCETTQNRDTGTGASLLGFSSLYGAVAGGQAEYLRVQFADFLPMKVPPRSLPTTVSSSSPTCCRPPGRAWSYADTPEGGTLLVMGAPVRSATWPPGSPCTDGTARHRGRPGPGAARAGSRARGAETIDLDAVDDLGDPGPPAGPPGAGPTPSSTRSAWRRTATPWPEADASRPWGLLPDKVAQPR